MEHRRKMVDSSLLSFVWEFMWCVVLFWLLGRWTGRGGGESHSAPGGGDGHLLEDLAVHRSDPQISGQR